MAETSVSIIIPSYNASSNLERLVISLNSQTIKPCEIIVIDDGSTDNTTKTINHLKKKYKLLKYFKQKNSGPAVARNNGAKKTKGNLILFTDSDCVPDKNWIKEMTSPFEQKGVVGVQGAYKTKQTPLIARFGQIEIEQRYDRMINQKEIDWIGSYSAGFKRKNFLELGGYDESFPIASGEDPEFSFRLAKNGGKLIFNPNAIVFHTHPSKLMKYLKTKFFRAYYRPKMYSKHKEKIITDSYTPQLLKIQIILVGLTLLSLLLINFNITSILILIFLITMIPFFMFAWKKDKLVAIASPIIVFLRSLVFGAGLIAGVVFR